MILTVLPICERRKALLIFSAVTASAAAFLFNVLFDLRFHKSRPCSRAYRIRENVYLLEPDFFCKSHSLLKIFFRFGRKAHHYIGSKSTIFKSVAKLHCQLVIFFGGIMSVHCFKGRIASALKRDMKLRTKLIYFGEITEPHR